MMGEGEKQLKFDMEPETAHQGYCSISCKHFLSLPSLQGPNFMTAKTGRLALHGFLLLSGHD